MQPRCSTWQGTVRGMATFAMLATCDLTGFADPPPSKNEAPKPLSKEIVKAWQKAGAEVGWMQVVNAGFVPPGQRGFQPPGLTFRLLPEKEGVASDLPGFCFVDWKE